MYRMFFFISAPIENIKELLENIIKSNNGKVKKLGSLNAFARFIARLPVYACLGYSLHDILTWSISF